MASARDKILWVLCDGKEHSGFECSKRFLLPGMVYPELYRLERAGEIVSRWEQTNRPWSPRQRLYRIKQRSATKQTE